MPPRKKKGAEEYESGQTRKQVEEVIAAKKRLAKEAAKALDFIVEKALQFKLGARGLRSICESIMIDAMFELPSNGKKTQDFAVTVKYCKSKLSGELLDKLRAA